MLLTFEQALEANTGHQIEDYGEFVRKRDRLENQSRHIADMLEKAGIIARKASNDTWAIGEITGCIERLPVDYRKINLIPSIAKIERQQMVRDMTYYLERYAPYARYAVITSGKRVPFGGDLRGRRETFHTNIRRWASEAKADFDIEVIFRGDEYTFNLDGAHLHANIVYQPLKKLSASDWSHFLEWSKGRLGRVIWKDCGRLKDVKEVVKYCCKLGTGRNDETGSFGIDHLDADQLAWFHGQMIRSKSCQPRGRFADFRKNLKSNGERIVRVFGETGSYLAKVKKCSGSHGGRQNTKGTKGPAENIVIGRQLPAPRFSSLFEPVTLVMGYCSDPKTGVGKIGLDIIRERSEQAKKWASYKVHTNPPTVQAPLSEKDMEKMPETESSLEGHMSASTCDPAQGHMPKSACVLRGAKSFIIKNGQKVPRLRGTKNHIRHKPITKHRRVVINNGQRVYC